MYLIMNNCSFISFSDNIDSFKVQSCPSSLERGSAIQQTVPRVCDRISPQQVRVSFHLIQHYEQKFIKLEIVAFIDK